MVKYNIEEALREHELEIEEHEKLLEEYDNSVTKYNKWNVDFRIEEAIKREEAYHRVLKNMKLLHMGNNPITDWEIGSGVDYELDTSEYISPPSSLFIGRKSGDTRNGFLYNRSNGLQINQGRIVTYFKRVRTDYGPLLSFRNISNVGSPSYQNTYMVQFEPNDDITVGVILGGTTHGFHGGKSSYSYNENWSKVRVTWWEDQEMLFVRVEFYYSGSWSRVISDCNDPNNRWSGNSILRCGVGYYSGGIVGIAWFDDTEIWKA